MAKFNFRPVEIEAFQFTGGAESAVPILEWADTFDQEATYEPKRMSGLGEDHRVVTPEHVRIDRGDWDFLYLQVGYWLIRSGDGQFVQCEADEFAKSFEEIQS